MATCGELMRAQKDLHVVMERLKLSRIKSRQLVRKVKTGVGSDRFAESKNFAEGNYSCLVVAQSLVVLK